MSFYVAEVGRVKGKQDLADQFDLFFFSMKDFGHFRIYIRSQARQTNRNAK